MKKFILIFLISITLQTQAQLDWLHTIGATTGNANIYAIAIASSGNVYVTGEFDGTVDFDPSSSTVNLTSNGSDDLFIQKLDPTGNLIWVKSIGGINSEHGVHIHLDASENVHVTGSFDGTADFNPNLGTLILSANGILDAFVLKLDSNGNFLWAKKLGGTGEICLGSSIDNDASSNVYISGKFSGTVDMDPSSNVFNLTAPNSPFTNYVFIVKLDSTGNFQWAKAYGGSSSSSGNSMTLDNNNNIFLTGEYMGTVDFDPDAGVVNMTSDPSSSDIYVLKLNPSGNFIWVKTMGSVGGIDEGISLAADNNGAICITGLFRNTVDFDPGPGVFNLSASNNFSGFIQKLDANGIFIWAGEIGYAGASIDNDITNNIYSTGWFEGTVDFDPGPNTFNITASSGSFGESYIVKLDPNGNFVWASSLSGSGNATSRSIRVNEFGEIHLVGSYLGTVDFETGLGINSHTALGNSDGFLLKLNQLVSIKEINTDNIYIYPNPTSSFININTPFLVKTISIHNITGELIHSETINTNRINLSHFPSGVYFLRIQNDNTIITKKLIKK